MIYITVTKCESLQFLGGRSLISSLSFAWERAAGMPPAAPTVHAAVSTDVRRPRTASRAGRAAVLSAVRAGREPGGRHWCLATRYRMEAVRRPSSPCLRASVQVVQARGPRHLSAAGVARAAYRRQARTVRPGAVSVTRLAWAAESLLPLQRAQGSRLY